MVRRVHSEEPLFFKARPGRSGSLATLRGFRVRDCERGWLGCRFDRRVSESANLVSLGARFGDSGSLATPVLRAGVSLRGLRVCDASESAKAASAESSWRAAQVLAPASGRVPASLRALRVCEATESSDEPPRLGVWERSDSGGCGRPLRRQSVYEGASPSQ